MTEESFPHKLTLNERKNLTMTGVTEVVSFEESAVVLKTSLGLLTVQGQELKLKKDAAIRDTPSAAAETPLLYQALGADDT